MRYFGIDYRARPLTSIATPAPPAISPTIRKPIPTQSTTVVFAPTFTTALTCGAPVAFIATIVQSPPSTFQLVATWPLPVAAAFQKRSRPGGPVGARPACCLYSTVPSLMSVTWLRATPARYRFTALCGPIPTNSGRPLLLVALTRTRPTTSLTTFGRSPICSASAVIAYPGADTRSVDDVS